MHVNVKIRAALITFTLFVSSLSIFIIPPDSIKADNGNDFEELLLLLTGFHPFVTAGWYENTGNGSIQIKGDIKFELYFSSTLSTQTLWKDDIEISIYSLSPEFDFPTKLENANTTIRLDQEPFGGTIQKLPIIIENINYTLEEEEILIFAVEVLQSGKPIGNIIEKRYEKKLKTRATKVAEFLNKSSNENLERIGDVVMEILGTAEEFGITAEEFASLANSFSSSSFVYNSKDYPSSVILPMSSGDNITLYFHSTLYDEYYESESFVDMIKETPNGTAMTWPTKLFSIDPYEPGINSEEWLLWFSTWLTYITIGAAPPEEEDLGLITYYLTGENTLILDEPEEDSTSKITLSSEPIEWTGISFNRNKIINNLTAELYAYYPKAFFLRKITVEATLFDEDSNEVIATDQQKLDRATMIGLLSGGPGSSTIFTFDEAAGKEIWNGHKLKLLITSSGEPVIYPIRKTKLFCGSKEYPSSIIFNLEETDNIKIKNDLEDQYVIPGGSTKFTLYIQSKYKEDNLKIEVIPEDLDDLDDWNIEYLDTIQISENSTVKIDVYVNSTNSDFSAYDTDKIDLLFNVSGKTGFVSKKADVEVSDNAVDYYIEYKRPPDKEIKHGTSGTYNFKIKNINSGLWYDSYDIEAFSEHEWQVELEYNEDNIDNGDEIEVKAKVFVPEDTEICYDVLTLKITSVESQDHDKEKIWTLKVITIVIGPNILEHTYNFFESVSESIGLDEFLGDYAAAFLIFLVLFIILIFLAPIIYLLRKKYVEIICVERIKEIDPDGKAEFEITLGNPTKDKHTYEIYTGEINSSSERWEISLDSKNIDIEPKQTQVVELTVKPTDYIKQDDWAEVKIIVKPVNKKKKEEISIVTSIKDAKPELKILGVTQWPGVFRKGDTITTSFRINNTGKVSADSFTVFLYVNGKEKNKVEDITIPCGGYAEIEIPWIAVKGKNEINIVVK